VTATTRRPPDRTRRLSDEEHAYYRLSRRVYALFAPVCDLAALPMRSLRDVVVDLVSPAKDSRVLDVATGTGSQAAAFARRCREVVGVDLSPAMLRVAAKKRGAPNPRLIEADATELPFEDASFDVSCISFALHEMPMTIRDAVLREMARVTKAGGAIAIVDYALPEHPVRRWLVYHFVKLYERGVYADFVHSDLDALLARAGLERRADKRLLSGAARIVVARGRDRR